MYDCPVCGFVFSLKDSPVCDKCGWWEDQSQEEKPDSRGGANWISLNEAKANYKKCGNILTEDAEKERKEYYEKINAKRNNNAIAND